MNDPREILSTGAWGTVLDGQQPPGQLAELDAQHAATPARLAGARALFEEASLGDFEAVGSKGRRWLHRETGIQYVVDESQLLGDPDPRRSGVTHFVVHAGRLLFLRPRDFDAATRGVPGQITSGEVRQAPGGGVRVVDSKSGHIVRDGLRL